MADINIENFYHHIAKILDVLYTAFPTKRAVYVDEVAGIDEPDEYGLHSPNYTAGFYALMWLGEEGYVRYSDEIRQDGIDQAILTHKAFLKLSEIADPIFENLPLAEENTNVVSLHSIKIPSPSVQEEQKLVITQLRTALQNGSSIAISKVMRYVLQN